MQVPDSSKVPGTQAQESVLDGLARDAPPPEPSSADVGSESTNDDQVMPAYSVAELRADNWKPQWLVKRLWPYPGHGAFGGADKSFKTWLLCFLAVAVASGRPFLNAEGYEVVTSGPVVMFTGESGRRALERRLRRIAQRFYGLTDAQYGALPLHVIDGRAPLRSERFRKTLRHHLADKKPVLVVLDPLYTYVGSGTEAGNVYDVGEALHEVSDACNEAGVAFVTAHHTRKTANGAAPTLLDLTQAGGREWVEAWVLIGHRQDPEPNEGRAWLLLQIGNRHGYGATVNVDLGVGEFDVDTFDYTGEMFAVLGPGEKPADKEERKAETKRTVQDAEVGQLLLAVSRAPSERETSGRALARSLGWGRKRVDDVVDRAIHGGYLEVCGEFRRAELVRLTESGKLRLAM